MCSYIFCFKPNQNLSFSVSKYSCKKLKNLCSHKTVYCTARSDILTEKETGCCRVDALAKQKKNVVPGCILVIGLVSMYFVTCHLW